MTDDKLKKTQDLNDTIQKLKDAVTNNYDDKRISLFIDWIKDWVNYISYENTFKPQSMRSYKKGDIITINLGFNVGSEQGGHRPAIVIGKNNRSDKTITIIPLGTVKDKAIQAFEYDLGFIEDLNKLTGEKVQSKAIINQLRVISKQRVINPKRVKDEIVNIGDEKYIELIQAINTKFFLA